MAGSKSDTNYYSDIGYVGDTPHQWEIDVTFTDIYSDEGSYNMVTARYASAEMRYYTPTTRDQFWDSVNYTNGSKDKKIAPWDDWYDVDSNDTRKKVNHYDRGTDSTYKSVYHLDFILGQYGADDATDTYIYPVTLYW
ncbi:hypothetical protein [Halobacillus dabanensis]|nr:hypothetical protein [Halobacillus dabanensis]